MSNDDSIQLSPILSMDCTKIANCTSKKRVLEIISELAAQQLHISSQIIFDALLTRERLGSTCIGNGIAIPHGKLEKDNHVVGVLIRLVQPIALDAVDHQPVDLIFALLAPLDQDKMHLKILSLVADILADKAICRRLRAAENDRELYEIITESTIV